MKIWKVGIFFVVVGILFNFIIPPFQNPDEPQHFGAVLIKARGEEQREVVEQEIIRFMDKHHWWKLLGMGRPKDLPDKISDIRFIMDYGPSSDFRDRLNRIFLYHFIMGNVVRVSFRDDIVSAYYLCRLVSFLFIFGAVFLTAVSLRKIAGKYEELFSWGLLFILFLPQFLVNIVSVNADCMAIFLSAAFFYAVVSLIKGEVKLIHFVLIYTSAVAGFMTDRSTFLLLPLSLIVPFFLIRGEKYKNLIVYSITFLMAVLMLSTLFVIFFPLQADSSIGLFTKSFAEIGEALPGMLAFDSQSTGFFNLLCDSFLLKFGWASFGTGMTVYFIWRVLIFATIIGVGAYFIKYILAKIKRKRREIENDSYLKITGFFLLAIVFQLLAVWTYYGSHGMGGQGRHFFPLILPIAFLFTLGLKTFGDLICKGAGKKAVAVFVLVEFIFLNYCIWNYLVPVFHLVIKSPHPGV